MNRALGALAIAAVTAMPPTATAQAVASSEWLRRVADEADGDLLRHVVKPRYPRSVERERGGFHANYDRAWTARTDEALFIVYQARMTWLPAQIALSRPALREEQLGYVRHGVAFLEKVFWDNEHGGFHDWLRNDGSPDPERSAVKSAYGQAFAVYALATAYRATGDAATLDLAKRGFRFIEDKYRDDPRPGYLGAVDRQGRRLPHDPDDVSPPLVAIGLPAAWKAMNPHIHLLEAYAELLRAWPDPLLRRRTQELLCFVRDRLFVEPGALHILLTPEGAPVPGLDSFGHDIETAYLLLEAEEALGVSHDPKTARAARMLVDHTLAWGFDTKTGQLFESGSALGPVHDRSIQWWAQYEALNALSLMHARDGARTPKYAEAFARAWSWTRERLLDPEHGGVYQGVDEHGKVNPTKSQNWFAGYHTGRALLLIADRFRALAEAPAAKK
jgi:mannobiose 2-epimerase